MTELEVLEHLAFKMFFAVICGSIVGIERELNHAQAGFKTQILICVGAMLFTVIPEISMPQPHANESARIIGQIISGVGFLGAGAIFYNSGNKVMGLTTAAWVWFTAAVGVMIGVGHGPSAVFITLTLAVTITTARKIERKLLWKTRHNDSHDLATIKSAGETAKEKKSA